MFERIQITATTDGTDGTKEDISWNGGTKLGGRGSSSGRSKNVSSVQEAASRLGGGVSSSGLPKLTGTEKQVSWANDIRADMIRSINDDVERQKNDSISRTKERQRIADTGIGRRGKLNEQQLERAKKNANEFARVQVEALSNMEKDVASVQRMVDKMTSAKRYIDYLRDVKDLKKAAFRARVWEF